MLVIALPYVKENSTWGKVRGKDPNFKTRRIPCTVGTIKVIALHLSLAGCRLWWGSLVLMFFTCTCISPLLMLNAMIAMV